MRNWRGIFSATKLPLEARHRSSCSNSTFNAEHLSFADYVSTSRDMIAKVRASQNSNISNKALEGNAPFELAPTSPYCAGKKRPINAAYCSLTV